MKTIKINLFEFNELSEQAKQRAIEKNYDINVEHDWWEFTYEDAKNIGLKLEHFDLDRNRHATGQFIDSPRQVAQKIMKDHGENCETYLTANSFLNEWENTKEEDIEELESNFLTDLLEDYSMMLQKESEYLQSEEAIIETFEANEYTFEEDGTMNNSN